MTTLQERQSKLVSNKIDRLISDFRANLLKYENDKSSVVYGTTCRTAIDNLKSLKSEYEILVNDINSKP